MRGLRRGRAEARRRGEASAPLVMASVNRAAIARVTGSTPVRILLCMMGSSHGKATVGGVRMDGQENPGRRTGFPENGGPGCVRQGSPHGALPGVPSFRFASHGVWMAPASGRSIRS